MEGRGILHKCNLIYTLSISRKILQPGGGGFKRPSLLRVYDFFKFFLSASIRGTECDQKILSKKESRGQVRT